MGIVDEMNGEFDKRKTIRKSEALTGFVDNVISRENGIEMVISIPEPKKPKKPKDKRYDKFYLEKLEEWNKRMNAYNALFDTKTVHIYPYEMENICDVIKLNKKELEKVRELLDKNIEAGFAICRNGAVTDIVEGDEDKLHTGTYFEEFCKERNSQVWVDVHSHPSGVEMPTIADMVNVAQEGGGNTWACVVTKKGIVCVKPKGEAKEIADKLHKKSSKDEDFRKLYDEYAKTLQPYERWRSYDIVERNVEVCKCE